MNLSRQPLLTDGKFFTSFKADFELLAEKQKIFKRIARLEY